MRFIYLFVLSLVLLQASKAQDTSSTLPISTISANRIEDKIDESGKSIQIIDQKTLSSLPIRSVQEALQYAAGIQVRARSLPHVQSDISIRGGGFDQVLILIDGVKLNDAQTGHHIMNIPLPLEAVERIEIIKGPAARVFGPNAYAGAINIITKEVEQTETKVGIYGGSFNSLGGSFYHAQQKNNWQHQFAVSRDYSDGYRENTDFDISQYYFQTAYQADRHSFKLQAGFTGRDFGANGFYAGLQFTDQYEEVQTSFTTLQHQYNGNNWVLRSHIYWRRNQDKYLFLRNNPDFYRNFHLGNNLGAETHATLNHKLGVTGLGLDMRTEILRSNLLGNRERLATAMYIEHQFELLNGNWHITPGALFNHYSDHGWNVLPGIETSIQVMPQLSFYGSAGLTFRVPTYTDLYYVSAAEVGNPELKAERAVSYDAGLRWRKGGFYTQAAIFQRTNHDLIDWIYQAQDSIWQAANIQLIEFRGLEFDMRYNLRNSDHFFNLKQLGLQYTYIDGLLSEDPSITSRYSFNHLRHQLTASANVGIAQFLDLQIAYRGAVPFQKINSGQFDLDTYNLIDLNIAYQWKRVGFTLEVVNLFDETYTGANLIPMPGRFVRFGVEYLMHP